MGKQPAVLIIARHGTRLDQANKQWASTAEKPWDPPLSYGGWIQSQVLGARIATELQNLDDPPTNDGANKDNTPASPRPRKRRRVVIHSSPYLRCVQTSTGIAAGLRLQDLPRSRPLPTPHQRSSLSQPPMSASDSTSPLPDKSGHSAGAKTSQSDSGAIDLKVDAWLGEWLSSGYFDKTNPPPPSQDIVRSAKEMLKLPSEEIKGADLTSPSVSEFDDVEWADKQRDTKVVATHEKTGLRAMAALGHSLPRRARTISINQATNSSTAPTSEPATGRRARSGMYSPPVPTYAISPQDSIPVGFVAHARDFCLDTDFDWDSQQPPLAWGDGGHFEEEWSTMHRRFLGGLQNILTYYEFGQPSDDENAMETDDGEDLVVVLVTHQAGCNALIRLVTGAPALHDVGTASLTLAVRKSGLSRKESIKSSTSPLRRGSLDLGISDDFEMKIIASTEHLRTGSNPLGLNSPRLGMSPALAGRRLVGPDSPEGFSIGDPLAWRSSSQTTIGRSSSFHRNRASDSNTSIVSNSSGGLWSGRTSRVNSTSSDMGWDPRFSNLSIHPGRISNNVILEDEAIENWAASGGDPRTSYTNSPVSLESQSTWQPDAAAGNVRFPRRSDSTRLTSNPTTGLWGSPVSNPGGVKEGTPHSRPSFGTDDAPLPTWGPRAAQKDSKLRNETSAN